MVYLDHWSDIAPSCATYSMPLDFYSCFYLTFPNYACARDYI